MNEGKVCVCKCSRWVLRSDSIHHTLSLQEWTHALVWFNYCSEPDLVSGGFVHMRKNVLDEKVNIEPVGSCSYVASYYTFCVQSAFSIPGQNAISECSNLKLKCCCDFFSTAISLIAAHFPGCRSFQKLYSATCSINPSLGSAHVLLYGKSDFQPAYFYPSSFQLQF